MANKPECGKSAHEYTMIVRDGNYSDKEDARIMCTQCGHVI